MLGGSVCAESILFAKIKNLIGESLYAQNRSFIEIIFSKEDAYMRNGALDVVKVTQTLKENGLLMLFYSEPRSVELTFSTNGTALFFTKLMEDTLHEMGYYRFLTREATLDAHGFVWKISMTSEYAIDPMILRKHLQKRGCGIIDIDRKSKTKWHYAIDMSEAKLGVKELTHGERHVFKRSLYAHWLDVSGVKKLHVWSLKGNRWYPNIAFYDKNMHLLKVYKQERKTLYKAFHLPKDTFYVKLSDLYSLKNIKDGLRVEAEGEK